MEYKIFLLIATLCIALVKSEEEEDYSEYSSQEYSANPYPDYSGIGYPGNFPRIVLLSDDDSPLWSDDEFKHSFQDCYTKESEHHKEAIGSFNKRILDEANEMNKKFNSKPELEALAQKIPDSAQALGKLLKEYQEKFSELVQGGDLDQIQDLKDDYENQIGDSDVKLDGNIRELKGKVNNDEESKNIVKRYEETIRTQQHEVTGACEKIMESLKQCAKKNSEK